MQSRAPVLAIAAALGLAIAGPVQGSSYVLTPIDDTFVYSGEADLAHGSLSGLATGYTFPHPEAGWVSYLKFDLGAIPGDEVITGATLNLYKFIVGAGYAQIGTNLFYLADDGWSEGGLTWNNQPLGVNGIGAPNFGTFIASNPDGFAHVGWSAWDLFSQSAWDPAADQADGLLSLQLAEMYAGDQSHNWCSKESDPTYCPAGAMYRPYLQVTTAVVPAPGAIWLAGTALLGLPLVAGRGRRKAGPAVTA
ncbi:MAG: DNRLRE domain-containing protein [Chromatiales bacterium]|nr:DNRLRE domain-containing protein [Chromatiales bacterium]